MGYISQARGTYVFDQPLLDDELVELKESMGWEGRFGYSLGRYFEPTMHGLEPADGDEVRAYELEYEVRELAKKHPGQGVIQVEGEETGDIWRLIIDGSTVTKQEIQLTWPGGTSYTPLYG